MLAGEQARAFLSKVVDERQDSESPAVEELIVNEVHARCIGTDKKTLIRALAVASEPEIFWRDENPKEIIEKILIPVSTGKLVPDDGKLNGPSGVTLDDRYLKPLGLTRSDVWLCDLVPHSCQNGG